MAGIGVAGGAGEQGFSGIGRTAHRARHKKLSGCSRRKGSPARDESALRVVACAALDACGKGMHGLRLKPLKRMRLPGIGAAKGGRAGGQNGKAPGGGGSAPAPGMPGAAAVPTEGGVGGTPTSAGGGSSAHPYMSAICVMLMNCANICCCVAVESGPQT